MTSDLLAHLARAKNDPDAPFDVVIERPMRYELGASEGYMVSIGDAISRPALRHSDEMILVACVAEATSDATLDGATSATQH